MSRSVDLPINFRKYKVMDISTQRTCFIAPLTISGKVIRKVDFLKFLWFTFSIDLKWHANFKDLMTKASQRFFLLRNLRKSNCDEISTKRAYHTCTSIRPVYFMLFPCLQCSFSPFHLLQKLFRAEPRAYRIMNVDYDDSDPPL